MIIDDVLDSSVTRRGVPCWYKKDGIGLNAMNDAILLEKGLFNVLRKYFSSSKGYIHMIELFHDITMKTSMGQALDLFCMKENKPNLDAFTMKRYDAIVKYKTAYYTFQLPVALAMYMANNFDEELHRQAKTILLEMGHFFQVQDDFLDCFGDPEHTGKLGTDIKEGKCSWLAVVALQRTTKEQRLIMEKYYGQPDVPEATDIIRNLYEDLGLLNTYTIYEEETYNLIKTHIQQISKGLPHELFFRLMDKMYRRTV